MSRNLNRSVKKGAVWVVIERGTLQFIHIGSSILLARLLTPSDFGVMGLSFLFTGLASRLVRFGFGVALVRLETLRPDHVSTLFVMTLGVNGLVFLGLVSVAPAVGAYFNNPLVGSVLGVMAFNFLVRCIGTCPNALLTRRMDFKAMTISGILDAVVKVIVTGGLAWNGWGVWSLAYGELAGGISEKIYMAIAARWRPSLRCTRAAASDLFGFGVRVSIRSTFLYLTDRTDNFFVGKYLGTAALGFYEKAFNLVNLPASELSYRLGGVLFPAFAKIHQDGGRLRAAYRKTVLFMSLVSYPLFGSMLVLAPELIRLMYGERWTPLVIPFQILCLTGPSRILTGVSSSVLTAAGSVGPEAKRRGVVMIALVVGALVGVNWGITGVAVAVTVVNFMAMSMIVGLLQRIQQLRFADFLRPQLIPMMAGLATIVAELGWKIVAMRHFGFSAAPVLVGGVAIGGLVYLLMVFLLRDDPTVALFHEVRSDLRPALQRISFGRLRWVR